MNAELSAAISQRKQIKITYNGAVRVVNPHVYGTDKNNQYRLRGTQQESDGVAHPAAWKLFDASKIESAEVLETDIEIAEGYKSEDSVITNVISKV